MSNKKETYDWSMEVGGETITFSIPKDQIVTLEWKFLVEYRKKVQKELGMKELSDRNRLIAEGEEHALMYIMSNCQSLKDE